MTDWFVIAGWVVKPLSGIALKKWAEELWRKLSNKQQKKARNEFRSLIQQELKLFNLSETDRKTYDKSLKKFISNKNINKWLSSAFQPNCQKLESAILTKTWSELRLEQMPDDFSWETISQLYLKKVENIVGESQKSKELFSAKKLQEIAENTKNLTGIIPDYNLERYRKIIKESYGHLKLSELDSTCRNQSYQVKLWQIFIPQNVKEGLPPSRFDLPKDVLENLRAGKAIKESFFASDFAEYQQLFQGKPSQSVLDIVKNEKYQYIVFLGDPGSGKSTLLQYLALDWAENPTDKIPLLIELRHYTKDENAPKDFLDYFHQGKRTICELNQNQLHEQLSSGNALVMFDGLDEIFNNDTYGRVIREIHAFSNKYKQVQIIITSRIVGYNPDELRNAEFTHFTLEDFNNNQIRQFIKIWHQLALPEKSSQDRYDTQKRLQTAINDSPGIRQLAGNPLLLTMMALLNRYQEIPRGRIDLYKETTNVLLHQWEIEYKKMELTLDDVNSRAKQGMLREIAYRMQVSENGMQVSEKVLNGNIIHRDDLEDVIADYYRKKGVQPSLTIAEKIITQLRERDFILCYLGKDYYGFVHRTFLEYFCAMVFIEKFNKRDKEVGLTIEELQEEVFGQHWQDQAWHEVLRLISGQLNEFVGDVINYLLGIYEETKEVDALILATECLHEVDSQIELEDIKNKLLINLKEGLNKEIERFLLVSEKIRNSDNNSLIDLSHLYYHLDNIQNIAKLITLYWISTTKVTKWLQNIAIDHQFPMITKKIAQGIAKARKIPYYKINRIKNISEIYFEINQYDKALNYALKERKKDGFVIAESYINLKRFDEGITYFVESIEKNTQEALLYIYLARIYTESGKYEEAVERLNQAIKLAKQQNQEQQIVYSSLILAITFQDWGKYQEAVKTLINIKSTVSSEVLSMWYNNFARIYIDLGEFDKAINLLNEAIKLNGKSSINYDYLGIIYYLKRELDKAIDFFLNAIEFDPLNYNSYSNLGLVYLLQNNYNEAEYYFLQGIKINKYFGDAVLELGILRALQDNIEQAKKDWEQGLKIYGEYGQNNRLFHTIYTIALAEKKQGLETLQKILTEEKPPVGLLDQVLQIAELLEKCPKIEGINTAITMIKNNMNS